MIQVDNNPNPAENNLARAIELGAFSVFCIFLKITSLLLVFFNHQRGSLVG
jgi:hypothetical protein